MTKSIHYIVRLPDLETNSEQFKFLILDDSSSLHINESGNESTLFLVRFANESSD